MLDIAQEVSRVRYPLLAVSASSWIALAAGASMHVSGMGVYCSATGGRPVPPGAALSLLLALNPPSTLVVGWALMLSAMMSPLVISEIHHVRFTSLTRRRARSITLFVAGYGGVWMLWAAALTGLGLAIMAMSPGPYVSMAFVGLVACVWQASPFKQRCLNKCHDKPPLRAFGPKADLDAFCFGWRHGVWCAWSCSAMMLVPMLLADGHLIAMAAIAIFVFCERLEDPKPPRWKLRGPGKAGRMIKARMRIRWRMLRRNSEPLLGQ